MGSSVDAMYGGEFKNPTSEATSYSSNYLNSDQICLWGRIWIELLCGSGNRELFVWEVGCRLPTCFEIFRTLEVRTEAWNRATKLLLAVSLTRC
jgi:hypothetical protein